MKRDFSDAAKQELLSLVAQVEDEKWCDFTDWIGDGWSGFEGWIGQLDISNYINDINTYHKKVIDKNNTTAEGIETIFTNVNQVAEQYKSRFAAILASLSEYNKTIKTITSAVTPGNGSFTTEYIGSMVNGAIDSYLLVNAGLLNMAKDGLTQEEISNMDPSILQKLLDSYAAVIVNTMPNIEIGQKLEMPIGPNVKMYYEVSEKLNGGSDVDLNYVIKDQQLEFKNFSAKLDSGYGLSTGINSDNELSVSSSTEGAPTITNLPNGVKVAYGNAVDNISYNYSVSTIYIPQPTLTIEESVTTTLPAGSVTSTIGIEYKASGPEWRSVPEPVTAPYPCQIPEFEVDWGSVLVATGVVVVVVAVLLIPETGGASGLLLLAV